MIRTVIISLIIHITLIAAQAQWVQQYPVTPFNHLYDVKFINNNTGWTCGNMGTIIKTTDGGKNWIRQNCPVTKTLYKIFPVDSQVVYCVGFFECILKTTNGGTNWNIIRNSTQQSPTFEALFFLNRDTGWISKNQYILKTTDGCKSFDSTFVKPSYIFDIYFKNYQEGLFCGEAATMYRTTNGGNNWIEINIVQKGQPLGDFMNLTFIDNNTGFSQGSQTKVIFKTTDFGLSWDSITIVAQADECYTIFFSSRTIGWCAGTFGKLFKTTNGGFNWNEVNLSHFNDGYIKSLWFCNDSIGWAVGAATKILHTNNGGMTKIVENPNTISYSFKLYQNYPNPFNPSTNIHYVIPSNLKSPTSNVKLVVYNALGKEIATLVNQKQSAGSYSVDFDGSDLSSGIYFYKLEAGSFIETKRMVLIK